jgi:wyosine [tRNA(Phe)-imidazoG37] synthetase (radical SAM superfamily)
VRCDDLWERRFAVSDGLARVVYGPVASWRLGRSLGVDMVSVIEKTCSFDCEYCQLGPTRQQTAERREFVPIAQLVREIEALPRVEIDYVTFSGTAEPTLAANLGDAIEAAKARLSAPIAVLTNSSLLTDAGVRRDLAGADRVVAKLDAATEEMLRRVNRPVRGITLDGILEGLHLFRSEYRGFFALQIMFYEANRNEAVALARLARELQPHQVEVNTPLRPCAVRPLQPADIAEIMGVFSDLLALSVYEAERPTVRPLDERETLQRRPGL